MSYRIEYDSGTKTYEAVKDRRGGAWLFAVFIAALAASFLPEIRSLVIPGEDALTVQAFAAMADDLRSGATVLDAVEAFCRIVIHGK